MADSSRRVADRGRQIQAVHVLLREKDTIHGFKTNPRPRAGSSTCIARKPAGTLLFPCIRTHGRSLSGAWRLWKTPVPIARVFPFVEPKKALEGACGRLKFPAFSPRALRRYFIRRSLRRGVDVGTVADWQGHQDGGALLLRVYRAEINRKHSLEMAKLLGDGAS